MDNRDESKDQRRHETGSDDDATPTGQGSTGAEGSMGGESWQDRTRDPGQEDTETSESATRGSQDETSRS